MVRCAAAAILRKILKRRKANENAVSARAALGSSALTRNHMHPRTQASHAVIFANRGCARPQLVPVTRWIDLEDPSGRGYSASFIAWSTSQMVQNSRQDSALAGERRRINCSNSGLLSASGQVGNIQRVRCSRLIIPQSHRYLAVVFERDCIVS